MLHPWHYFCYLFGVSVVNSLTLSITYVSCHSVFIDDFKFDRNSVFDWRFMDLQWHSVFENSMRHPCLYFCYGFDTSVVNSLTMSITHIGSHSLFIDYFKVYSYSFFVSDLRISRDIAFLTIPCVSHRSIFPIDLIRQSWTHWRCQLYTSAVTQYSLMISRSIVTLFSATIFESAVT